MARDWCRLLLGALLALQPISAALANERLEAAPPDVVEAGTPSFVVYAPESLGLIGAPTDLKQLPDGRILVVDNLFASSDGSPSAGATSTPG